MKRKPPRESEWTRVYLGSGDKENPWYIRLVPVFVNLEATGFPHGLSISGNTFSTKEAAETVADFYDQFFNVLREEIIQDYKDQLKNEPT